MNELAVEVCALVGNQAPPRAGANLFGLRSQESKPLLEVGAHVCFTVFWIHFLQPFVSSVLASRFHVHVSLFSSFLSSSLWLARPPPVLVSTPATWMALCAIESRRR
jgi:hypothetical protein